MNISDLHADVMSLPRTTTGSRQFIDTCQAARLEINRLLHEYDYEEAATLSGALNKMFSEVRWKGSSVMAEILTLFPVNKPCTLRHLGKDPEVDKIIFDSKLKIEELSSFDGDAWLHVLEWARKAKDRQLIERVVLQIVNDIHENGPNNGEHLRDVSLSMIQNIAPKDSEAIQLGDAVDTAIASIISFNAEKNVPARQMPLIAGHGLRKTFMRLLDKNAFLPYFPHLFSDQQNRAVYCVLPSNPTPAETFAIQQSIAKPGINERILFDLTFDIEAYIEVLRPPKADRSSNLCFPVLKFFRSQLTPEHLNTPDRKRRAGLLINAVVDHQMKRNRRTPEEIRTFLVNDEFDPYVLKMTRVLKGTILEEELGL